MKVAILAGGFGTRLSEETSVRPKPMVEVGGRPIIWHIMKTYAHYGFKDFVILGGYKVEYIRDYFLNYRNRNSDFTVDFSNGAVQFHEDEIEDWRVTVLDTGYDSMTAGRIKRAQPYLEHDRFFLTYGDGVSDVPVDRLLDFHRQEGGWCTLTAVQQPGRYGALQLDKSGRHVQGFREKAPGDGGRINGGFFVCEPEIFDLIDGDQAVWENGPMSRMTEMGKLNSYMHDGYWQSMDSLRDKMVLEKIWAEGDAPWAVWNR